MPNQEKQNSLQPTKSVKIVEGNIKNLKPGSGNPGAPPQRPHNMMPSEVPATPPANPPSNNGTGK